MCNVSQKHPRDGTSVASFKTGMRAKPGAASAARRSQAFTWSAMKSLTTPTSLRPSAGTK